MRAGVPLVLDPVMVAKGGAPLLADRRGRGAARRLLPLATVLTPNLPEAEALAGVASATSRHARARPRAAGAGRAGGAAEGRPSARAPVVATCWRRAEPASRSSSAPRIATRHTHGTGCTLASAIAAGLAQGLSIAAAVARARAYVFAAIRTAPGYGHGHGPLNHAHTVAPFPA